MPLTATRTEVFAGRVAVPLAPRTWDRGCRLFAVSPDPAILAWIEDWARSRSVPLVRTGYHLDAIVDTVESIESRQVDGSRPEAVRKRGSPVIVFDVDPWTQEQQRELRGFVRRHPAVAIVAICGFPSEELRAALKRIGVHVMVSKCAPLQCLDDAVQTAAGINTDSMRGVEG